MYQSQGAPPVELIARQGYSGMGAFTAEQLAALKKQYVWQNGKCVNLQTGKPYPGDQKLSNCQTLYGPAPKVTTWSKFLTGFATALPGAGGVPQQPGIAPTGGMPSWLLPVALGGGALVLVLVLRKK